MLRYGKLILRQRFVSLRLSKQSRQLFHLGPIVGHQKTRQSQQIWPTSRQLLPLPLHIAALQCGGLRAGGKAAADGRVGLAVGAGKKRLPGATPKQFGSRRFLSG